MKPIDWLRNAASSFSLSWNGSRPSSLMEPELGGSSAPTIYSSVLLPEPEGPMIAAESPRFSEKFTPERIARGPRGVAYSLVMFETSSMDAFSKDAGIDIECPRRHAGHTIVLADTLGAAASQFF